MAAKSLTFDTRLEPFGPACAVMLSDEQVAELGGGKRAAVIVTIDGKSAPLRLAVMGGKNCIGLSKASRALLGVEMDQQVTVTVTLDEATREVELPPELTTAFAKDTALASAFEALAYTHRKTFATWVGEAKRPETRARRAAEAVEMIREGRTRQ
ncbi:MAG: YdeI/OmpD-associated family protein [Dermatophilus congolensis]|nr:YdeI/OmpD-associated family protein [Dermatophilus congolensis]